MAEAAGSAMIQAAENRGPLVKTLKRSWPGAWLACLRKLAQVLARLGLRLSPVANWSHRKDPEKGKRVVRRLVRRATLSATNALTAVAKMVYSNRIQSVEIPTTPSHD